MASAPADAPPSGLPPAPIRVVAKGVTRLVAAYPRLWPLFRGPMRGFFDRAAAGWDSRIGPLPEHLAGLVAALERVSLEPRRILDLGTGSGVAALMLARRFPGATVVGIDLSRAMIEAARAKLDGELAARVEFAVADAASLPYENASFDLMAQVSVPVFFDEMARVLAPGGHAVVVNSLGPATPVYVPDEVLERGLGRRGLERVATGRAGRGTYFVARRPAEAA